MILSDRLVWEKPYAEGAFHTLEERQARKQLVAAWAAARSLDHAMDARDATLLSQAVDTIDPRTAASRSFEFEAVEPLLWACGFVEQLTPANRFICRDFHPLLIETPLAQLCRRAALRSEAELAARRDRYMLWYWRSRVGESFTAQAGHTVIDAIAAAFSPAEVACARKIRRTSGDFAVRGRPFSQLSKKERFCIGQCIRWRYHALEWVLNDETWYDTSTDT